MKIVYFDGYCNVCNAFVDFLIRRTDDVKFASLQGSTAEQRLPASFTSAVSTMVFESEGRTYQESSAAIRALAEIGGVWSLMKIFLLVPPFVCDAVYRWVARHRYLWWGKRDTCRVPSAEERARFLD